MLPAMHRGDERPSWVATVSVNGVTEDMTSGFTFTVKLWLSDPSSPALTKTTGITGGTGGTVTVAWSGMDTDQTPGVYTAQLTAKRTSDDAEWTIDEKLPIAARA